MLVGFEPTPASAFPIYSVCKPFVEYYHLLCLPIHQATCYSRLQSPISSLVPYENTLAPALDGYISTNGVRRMCLHIVHKDDNLF